ncbi:hypothetical protein N7509_010394 [Penicillium cosmopolitanum]|uniref:Nucleoporin Nup159/Nup146 N-terminal domain-containing protein n=1 Tax=Penicillium cosmopolitanum TaxID=1131564 RepID=A0A9W9VR91_9EURO|nr:uncharacterized protein N7509_010394 [Penicillium cosmopolitanum]KAJ5387853.1 hypothetical protein N7509_010394 [Penicillium cosmopolitanum]
MAFSGFGNSNPAGGSAQAELGPELSDVFTDEIGFKGVAGDCNIRFLPTPWPVDALPSPTCSLLAVAQSKGLAVAAGPDALVVATTESIRKSIEASTEGEKVKTKSLKPLATIPLPSRPTHIAFNASDDALILATENGSQISVFQTTSLTQDNAQPALSVSTNGASIRALVPNPDSTSNLVALVTVNGELLVADLKAGNLVSGANGPILRNGVSCVAWSNKGKQLVAGLADGTGDQMTADGTKKAEIPRPADLEGECHVSSISWLENDVFFVIYTPNSLDDMGENPPSSPYIITRRKGAPFLIQRLPEVCSTLGFRLKRGPAYQFITRLRDYQPHMKDVLIVSSTASADVGLVTRSDQPLADDDISKGLVGQYVTTEINNDSQKAAVPLRDSADETSIIGLAADLSSTENVYSPIQGQEEEIPESSSPLPGLLLLNNDGVLCFWWFIYNQAIKQQISYSGLVSGGQTQQLSASTSTPAQQSAFSQASPAPQQPAFGQSSFGQSSSFGASAFGKPAGGASFGSPSTMGATAFGKQSGPAFGSPSPMGGAAPAPAFGQPSAPAPSFGTPSKPGATFGTAGTPAQPAFGQSGFGAPAPSFGQPNTPAKSLLGTGGGSTGGGFSSFSGSGGGGFSSFATSKAGESSFSKPAGESSFGKPSEPSPFGKPVNDTTFPKPSGESSFGKPSESSPFGKPVNDSTFPKPSGESSFGKSSGPSPFGKPVNDSVFSKPSGENGFGKSSNASPFGKPAVSSPFSSVATNKAKSPLGEPKNDSPFPSAGTSQLTNPFGKPSNDSSFPTPGASETNNPFGQQKTGGFVLGTSFKPDGTAANDGPKSSKPSTGALSFGASFGDTVSSPGKGSPSSESMDSDESEPEEPANKEPFSIFGKPSNQTPSMFSPLSSENTKSTKVETSKSKFSFSNNNSTTAISSSTQNQVTSPLSAPSDKTATPRREQSVSTPTFNSSFDAPLPPDSMSRASYAAGDTSASSNSSSQEDAPLPPDFLAEKKSSPKFDDAPLPPDFVTKKPAAETDDAPLPPDFLPKPKKAESPSAVPEEAPLPPDFLTKVKTEPIEDEETVPIPDGSDADFEGEGSDFSDSGEEITHDDTKIPSPEASPESSFGGISEKSATGGLFGGYLAKFQSSHSSRPPGPVAQNNREPYRSPSPTRLNSQRNTMFSKKPEQRKEAGSALATRKASLSQMAQRGGQLRKASTSSQDEKLRARQAAQRQEEEEALSLSDDDEDERLRADLARPVEPVATLDPFLPHQNYTGETAKPGVPGMIERLYRDINSMVDTLGINARSLDAYLLYQQPSRSSQVATWVEILKSEQPSDILDQEVFLQNITNLDEIVTALRTSLDDQRVQGVEEKLAQCHELLTKDIVSLRSLFASIRKILDAHTDTGSIIAAPLSAEQATLQQDLRTHFTEIQAKMAGLEEGVSLLRAKIADIPRADGTSASNRKRPTVEAVASTIATMMSMAEGKSSDIDVLEAQMRKLGVDVSTVSSSREGSPFTTPRKNAGRFPATPGSRGSVDGSSYHTPESASRGVNFRASMNGSAKHSRLRSVEGVGQIVVQEETSRWKSKNSRRQHLVGNLKSAIEKKDVKLRTLDDDWVVVDKK